LKQGATEQSWMQPLSDRDRKVLEALGHAARQGFGRRPALLVIDCNYDFCGAGPAPILEAISRWRNACGEHAWAAIKVIRRLLDASHTKGLPVFYSTNTRRADGFDAGSWRWKHAHERGQQGPRIARADDIVDEIAPAPQDVVIQKTKPSVFFGTPFLAFLVDLQVDSLIVCGGSTSGCVRASVVDAFSNNLRCAVVAEGCFDRLQVSHASSLLDMQSRYADVVSCVEALDFIASLESGMFRLPGT